MKITEHDLAGFYGTVDVFSHWSRQLVYTDGIHYLVENGAAWLLDVIASYQTELRGNQRLQEFQLWNLKLDGKGGCVITCQEDSDQPNIVKQEIGYTDFPFDIKLYVEPSQHGIMLLLPSEH